MKKIFVQIITLCFILSGLTLSSSLIGCESEDKQEDGKSGNNKTESNKDKEDNTEIAEVDDSDDALYKQTHKLLKKYASSVNPPHPNLENVDYEGLGTCFTKSQKADSKRSLGGKDICSRLSKEASSSKNENGNSMRSYYSWKNVHYRIDYGWSSRTGYLRSDKFGCWDSGLNVWRDAKKAEYCTNGDWKLRSFSYKKNKKGNMYSGTTSPTKPHLLTLINKNSVDFPEKFYCKVTEVTPKKFGKVYGDTITCNSYKKNPNDDKKVSVSINLPTGSRVDINKGDVVAAPFSTAPKTGILLSGTVNKGRLSSWTLTANHNSIEIVEKAKCPTQKELNPHICRFASSKSKPVETYEACIAVNDIGKVTSLAKSWDKNKKIPNKNTFMVTVLDKIIAADANNMWAYMSKAQNQFAAGQNQQSISTLKQILSKSRDAKEIMSVASLAGKMESTSLQMDAYQKACDLGNNGACKKLPKEEEAPE
jgi:hypothetical protein